MMRQIILITDGCSNVGISPVIAAAHAFAEDIVVNVVGVVDEGEIGSRGREEIEEIARAGGGLSRLVPIVHLAKTMQMMTRKTVVHTVQQAVQKELRQIFGNAPITALPPDDREKVVELIDDMAETSPLQVALLVDASASMKPKMKAVEDAIRDLLISLQARAGKSEISVFHFPKFGGEDEEIVMDLHWTRDLAKIGNLFYKLNMKGTTPTGPALMQLVRFMVRGKTAPAERWTDSASDKGGMLGDYII